MPQHLERNPMHANLTIIGPIEQIEVTDDGAVFTTPGRNYFLPDATLDRLIDTLLTPDNQPKHRADVDPLEGATNYYGRHSARLAVVR